MKFKLLFFISFFTFTFSACDRSDEIVIKPLHPFHKVYNSSGNKVKHTFYYVENYSSKDSTQIRILEQYAKKNIDLNFSNYDIYTIFFYKKSSKTNGEFKETESDIIEWHGDDLICSFEWDKGKFVLFTKY